MKTISEKDILNMRLNELGATIKDGHILFHGKSMDMGINLNSLNIKLEQKMPEITLRNLGKYMALFDRYPKAKCKSKYKEAEGAITFLIPEAKAIWVGDKQFNLNDAKIVDEYWQCIEHESCPLCVSVRGNLVNNWKNPKNELPKDISELDEFNIIYDSGIDWVSLLVVWDEKIKQFRKYSFGNDAYPMERVKLWMKIPEWRNYEF